MGFLYREYMNYGVQQKTSGLFYLNPEVLGLWVCGYIERRSGTWRMAGCMCEDLHL